MCGRFVTTSTPDEVAKYFDSAPPPEAAAAPNYNVAPTTDIPAVLEEPDTGRQVAHLHWGLVPFWAKDPSVGNRMINARAEGLADKNAYRRAFKRTRCIIPADGFYEWKKVPGRKRKQPYFIFNPDGELFAFAGLWESWKDESGDGTLRSATIVTTTPNGPMSEIHDRMPVILPASAWDRWLDPTNEDTEDLAGLLVPAPDRVTAMHPVSTDVGNVRNRGPHLIEEIDPDAESTG